MNKILTIVLIVLSFRGNIISQGLRDFYSHIKSVQFIDYAFNEGTEKSLIANSQELDLINAISEYFKTEMQIKGAIISNEQRTELYKNISSICYVVLLDFKLGDFVSQIGAVGYYPLDLTFRFCNSQEFNFNAQLNVNGLTASFSKPVKKGLDKIFYVKIPVDIEKKPLSLITNEIIFQNENELSEHFKNSEIEFEGTYELFSTTGRMPIKKLSILSKDEKYLILHNENNFLQDDWKFGEYRGSIERLNKNIFKGYILGNYKSNITVSLIFKEDDVLEMEDIENKQLFRFVKSN